jgi:hypothetical protein
MWGMSICTCNWICVGWVWLKMHQLFFLAEKDTNRYNKKNLAAIVTCSIFWFFRDSEIKRGEM